MWSYRETKNHKIIRFFVKSTNKVVLEKIKRRRKIIYHEKNKDTKRGKPFLDTSKPISNEKLENLK